MNHGHEIHTTFPAGDDTNWTDCWGECPVGSPEIDVRPEGSRIRIISSSYSLGQAPATIGHLVLAEIPFEIVRRRHSIELTAEAERIDSVIRLLQGAGADVRLITGDRAEADAITGASEAPSASGSPARAQGLSGFGSASRAQANPPTPKTEEDTVNQDKNSLHQAFDDMTDKERIAHIEKHTFVAETAVEIFEVTTGHKIHLIADKYWGDSICYIARYRWMKTHFAVDRRLPFAAQSALLRRGLARTMAEYHSELLDRELKIILNQNNVWKA